MAAPSSRAAMSRRIHPTAVLRAVRSRSSLDTHCHDHESSTLWDDWRAGWRA
jgi:hypothetical protein